MSTLTRVDIIHDKLTQSLTPTVLELMDDSAQHRGHAGAANGAGHYTVKIASPEFKGKTKVECHKLIYNALAGMIPDEIHALKIMILDK